jgi:hypothetical protein
MNHYVIAVQPLCNCCANTVHALRNHSATQSNPISLSNLHSYFSLPSEVFRRMTAFSSLNVSKNRLRELPASLSASASLEALVCSHNALQALPSFERCSSLKRLDATANGLTRFPALPALAEGLQKNALQFLHLGYNQVPSTRILQASL